MTCDLSFQSKLNNKYQSQTPNTVKVLGMNWNCEKDTVSPLLYKMSSNINTKRLVLHEINRNFDLTRINIPILNRAKLFLHKLQND